MSKRTIWDYFKQHTQLSDEAIAGIMGNMQWESGCESNRVEGDNDETQKRQPSIDYTNRVMSGAISLNTFIHDAKGYGLCQWTYPSRKENLYNSVVVSEGKRIDDEGAQLRYMLLECQLEFSNLWQRLLATNDITTAAGMFCREFERPAVNNITDRTKLGREIYNQFHGKDIDPTPEPTEDWLDDWIEYLEDEKQRIQAKIDELKARQ